MLEEPGCAKGENGHHADPSLPGIEEGISCACVHILYCARRSIDIGW